MTRDCDLVLEGGGVKGIGLVGAITALASAGYRFRRVAGTSAGAIVGALVAACTATGRPLGHLVKVMESVDYERFRDRTLLDHLGAPGEIAELLIGEGIYRGDYLVEWLSEELDRIGVRTFADLRQDDPDSSLPANQRYGLVVMASDLSAGQLVRLPWDYHRYGLDPDQQSVAAAVRASMSIPFFFKPVTLPGRRGHQPTVLVDGGMLSNFPVEVFDRTDGRPARWPTIGVKLSARPAAVQVPHPTGNVVQLAFACLHTLMSGHDRYHLEDEGVTQRTIFVDTLKVSTTDFGIEPATQRALFDNGVAAGEDFVRTFVWPPTPPVSPYGETPTPRSAHDIAATSTPKAGSV